MASHDEKIARLEIDLDTRLTGLWFDLCEQDKRPEGLNLEFVAALMRAAYGKGYMDCLKEPTPGDLCRAHGYRVPRTTAEVEKQS